MTGEKLSQILENRGIKKKWISEKLGVSQSIVSQWTKGKPIPDDKLTLIKKLLSL